MQKFWLIWNERHGPPTTKHFTEDSADEEAKRLARLHPGEKFHVLESIYTVEVQDINVTVHEREIPF